MNKKRKNIDLSDDCIKELTKAAVDEGTVFKLFVEKHLEGLAIKIKSKKQKS